MRKRLPAWAYGRASNGVREFVAIGGAAVLSFAVAWWYGGTIFATNTPRHVFAETQSGSEYQHRPVDDYQQRLDLYNRLRDKSENRVGTPAGGYLPSQTAPSGGTEAEIRQAIIRQSIAQYQGTGHPCACPYNLMRNGRSCGD